MTDEELNERIKQFEIDKNSTVKEELGLQPTHADSTVHIDEQKSASSFSDTMDAVKVSVLAQASAEDKKFVETVKENLKDAAVTHTKVEQKKAQFAKQQVEYESEKLETKQEINKHLSAEEKWSNKQKRRQYHYDGVKPIMKFVGIADSLNLFLLYLLTIILTPFFLTSKLLTGTVGALIAGASDSNRPKAVKGFLWTLLAIIVVIGLLVVIYLFLKWQKII